MDVDDPHRLSGKHLTRTLRHVYEIQPRLSVYPYDAGSFPLRPSPRGMDVVGDVRLGIWCAYIGLFGSPKTSARD